MRPIEFETLVNKLLVFSMSDGFVNFIMCKVQYEQIHYYLKAWSCHMDGL